MPTPPTPDKTVIQPEDAESPINPDPNHYSSDVPLADAWTDTRVTPDTLPLDTIKAALASRAVEAAKTVADLRKERERLNRKVIIDRNAIQRQIKAALTELADANRIANSLTPRKPRTKKAAK